MSGDRDERWEEHADWWIAGFTDGADPEYQDQILPLAAQELAGRSRVLDLGCGDGQVGRHISGPGVHVVGVDPTWNQIRVAGERAGGPAYAQAAAADLPCRDASFDGAVACLVFEHIDDLTGAVAEVARVLRPGGRFCLFLNHPLLQAPGSGWVEDHTVDPPDEYWRLGPYLVESSIEEQVERGVWIRFVHRPLSRYLNELIAAGFVLEHVLEPAPPDDFLARAPGYAKAAAIPRVLYLRLRRAE